MKTEVRVKWTDALRSGRYEKAKGTLRRLLNPITERVDGEIVRSEPETPKIGNCCLGVAACEFPREGDQWNLNVGDAGYEWKGQGKVGNLVSAESYLPSAVAERMGLPEHVSDFDFWIQWIDDDGETTTQRFWLSGLNDYTIGDGEENNRNHRRIPDDKQHLDREFTLEQIADVIDWVWQDEETPPVDSYVLTPTAYEREMH